MEVPREAWKPWSMGALTKPPSGAAAGTGRANAAVDVSELNRLRQEARDAGAAEGRKEGLQQGYCEGHAQGLAAGNAAVQAQAAQLLALAHSLPQALRRADEEISRSLVALALDVARQVVHRTLDAAPELLVPLVQDLLHQEPALQGDPRLLLHPLDAELVTRALGTELLGAGWSVRPDESVSRGGCLVQSGTGAHDATLETRWSRVIAVIGAESPQDG